MSAERHIRSEPTISYVVIGRNEEHAIGRCIESVLQSSRRFDSSEIVFVDSRSTDSTVDIAVKYPIVVLRLLEDQPPSPAAGRAVGTSNSKGEYIMFVDGDMMMNAEWPFAALEFMKGHPEFGAVYGRLTADLDELPTDREDASTGGVKRDEKPFKVSEVGRIAGAALVKRSALEIAGGLNPYLTGDEEAELSHRLKSSGFKIGHSGKAMAFHPERRNATVAEALRRFRYGYFKGQGKVLKASYRQGRVAFLHHLRRLRVYVLYSIWNFIGIVLIAMGAFGLSLWPLAIWILGTIAGIVSIALKHGFRDVPRRLLSSLFVSIGIIQALFQRLPKPADFPAGCERLK